MKIEVDLFEYCLLHERIGFLQGSLIGLRYSDDCNEAIDRVLDVDTQKSQRKQPTSINDETPK